MQSLLDNANSLPTSLTLGWQKCVFLSGKEPPTTEGKVVKDTSHRSLQCRHPNSTGKTALDALVKGIIKEGGNMYFVLVYMCI